MKLSILDALVAPADLGNELAELKEFRRATRSILKGVALIRQILARNPDLSLLIANKKLGFIVGTSVGEIEVTRDFLKDLALTQTARPFLFQLSSHHSTCGFLAQYFGLRGAALTLSNEYQSAEAALENASLLLHAGHCEAVLVFCVDQNIPGWMDLPMFAAHPQLQPASGAAVMLVAGAGVKAKAILRDLNYGVPTKEKVGAQDFYDSNSLEFIARLVDAGGAGSYRSVRPDGTLTEFALEFSRES